MNQHKIRKILIAALATGGVVLGLACSTVFRAPACDSPRTLNQPSGQCSTQSSHEELGTARGAGR